ncbi:MAG: carboxypeptidase-like regulatory domain-containing protein [Candidatus Aegiribacteria sp.]|nr:carboxypeptidase-like regulatory domain-containing protein [Candidatus Aegiribacteria sp.]
MRSFVFLFALTLSFISHAAETNQSTEPETGTIIGRVTVAHINELYGVEDAVANARVMVRGTLFGAMTDSLGYFAISNLPMGAYDLTAHVMDYSTFSPFSIQVLCNDTTDVGDVFVSPQWPNRGHYFIWPYFENTMEVEVELISDSILNHIGDLVQFYTVSTCLPSTRSGHTYRISLNDSSNSLHLRIPGFWELSINFDDARYTNGVYRIKLDYLLHQSSGFSSDSQSRQTPDVFHNSIPDEWLAEEYQADHEYIDITQWGNSDLINWGFIGHKVIFDELDNRSILLIYHHRAVLLRSNQEPKVIEFTYPVKVFRSSPNGRYVLAMESVGFLFQGGNAEFIDMITGNSTCFDPSPELQEPDRAVSLDMACYIAPFYFIGNCGRLVRVEDDRVHFYNEDFTLDSLILLDNLTLPRYCRNRERLTPDGDYLLQVGLYEDNKYVLIFMNSDGNHTKMIDLENRNERGELTALSMDGNCKYVLLFQYSPYSPGRTRLFNASTGQILKEWNERTVQAVFSPSGNLVCNHFELSETPYLSVLSTETLENVLIIPDAHPENYEDLSIFRAILGLSDNGYIFAELLSEQRNDIELRYALFDDMMNPIWLSSCFSYGNTPSFDYRRNHPTLSPDGTRLSYMDGRYLHLITFSNL